jgi:hypothetical protein
MKNDIGPPELSCDWPVAQLVKVSDPAASNNVHCIMLRIEGSSQVT